MRRNNLEPRKVRVYEAFINLKVLDREANWIFFLHEFELIQKSRTRQHSCGPRPVSRVRRYRLMSIDISIDPVVWHFRGGISN